jgi:hypothetical protein
MVWGITRQDHRSKKPEQEHTLSYYVAPISMRILELENRCTGNRTVGSNPTLSVPSLGFSTICAGFWAAHHKSHHKCLRPGIAPLLWLNIAAHALLKVVK